MTNEEILKICPQISKITFSEISEILGDSFNPDKTWSEMGFDDLDLIELIMMLEKRIGFDFPDHLFEHVFSQHMKPINFSEWLRNKKLDELGIR